MSDPIGEQDPGGFFVGITLGTALAYGAGLGSWGYLIGMAVGTLLFPPKYPKPDPYTELGINTAQTDIPIPLLYGTKRIGGNYIWRGALTAVAVKSSGGGKGTKHVVGYKYYMNSATGLCQGESYISRLWMNDEVIRLNEHNEITLYQGLTDQTIDPIIQESVDNPVPYRGLCYMVFDDYYIGENNAQAPIITAEAHRYPFNINAGDNARVYNHLGDVTASDVTSGFSVKDMHGNIITVGDDGSTDRRVKLYNKELDTIIKDNPVALFGIGKLLDVAYQVGGGHEYLYLLFTFLNDSGLVISRTAYESVSSGTLITSSGGKDTVVIDRVAADGRIANYRRGSFCFNKDKMFVVFKNGQVGGGVTDTFTLLEYNKSDWFERWDISNPQPQKTEYDITSDMLDVQIGSDSVGIDANDDLVFLSEGSYVYTFDIATITRQSYLDLDSIGMANIHSIAWLIGGDEIVTVRTSHLHDSWLEIIGFDKDGGNLTYRKEKDISGFWKIEPTWNFTGWPIIECSSDGTLLIGYIYGEGIQHIITDCNPSQIFYDVFIVEREMLVTKIDLPSLSDLGDYCFDNNIGVSLLLNAQQKTAEFLQTLLSYIQGTIFINNNGLYEFKVYRNTDIPIATITDADIVKRDYQKVNVQLKDRDLMANRIDIKFSERIYDYKESSFQADNFLAQEKDEEILSETVSYIWFSNRQVASVQAYRLLKFAQYDTKIFTFYLMPKYLYANIGDVLTLNIPDEQLNNQKVRIISLDEPNLARGGDINVTARLEADYLNTFYTYKISSTRKKSPSVQFPTNIRPVVFEQPSVFNNDMNTVCICYIRFDDSVIGVDVYVAEDDLNYQLLGSIDRGVVIGDINKAIGDQYNNKTLYVNTESYVDPFAGFTVVEQRNDRSFSLIGELVDDELGLDNLEFVTYRDIDQNGNIATLEKCYRGKYYTVPKTHITDEVLLDVEFERYLAFEYPNDRVGKTVFIKCVSKNLAGDIQSIENVDAYEYTLQGYTKKATHVSGLELRESGIGLGDSDRTINAEPELIWLDTNRVGGMASLVFNEWLENRVFLEGDIIGYRLYIYNSTLVLKATRTLSDVQEFTYTVAMQTTDFGAPPSEMYIDVEPFNANGSGPDRVRKHILKV